MATNYLLVVRRYAPMASFGGGFEGDSRTAASTEPGASARTCGKTSFNLVGVGSAEGSSSGSTYVGPWNLLNGGRLTKWIGRQYSEVRVTVSKVQTGPNSVAFTVYTEGGNPLTPRRLTPDIDTFVDFRAELSGGQITFSGVVRGDGFPNAEIFVVDDLQKPMLLLDYRTRSGVTGPFTRLFGSGAKNTIAQFRRAITLDAGGHFAADSGMGLPIVVQET